MKKKTLTAVLPLLTLALSSCGTTIQYKEHLDDYVYAMKFHENFNVLQLTDIHWSYDSSTCASKTYLEKVIKESDSHIKKAQGASAKIDLIEITGDQEKIDAFIALLDGYEILELARTGVAGLGRGTKNVIYLDTLQ